MYRRRLGGGNGRISKNGVRHSPAAMLKGLRNHNVVCVEDIFIACTDNLTGFSAAIEARQKKLCKSRQAVVKKTGANQGVPQQGTGCLNQAYPPVFREGRRYARAA